MIEEVIKSFTFVQWALVTLGAFVVYDFVKKVRKDSKIRRLGGRAPMRKGWLPFGLDIAYSSLMSLLRNETVEHIGWIMKKFGNKNHPYTVEFQVAGQRIVMTADHENIKAILATQFNDYGKGPKFNEDFHDFLGDSIFTTDGEIWHNSRQLIRPQFIKDRLSDIQIFERHSKLLVPLLGAGSGKTVDVLDLFFRFTLDASTDFLLGRSVESLSHPQTQFAEAFNDVQHTQSMIVRVNDLNWMIPRRKFKQNLKVMNDFVEPFIESALALSADELEKRTKSDEGYTFLHAIAGYTRERKVLRDQLVAILLAGRDTTACTLSWLFYELSLKPEVVKKLRAEIMSRVGPTNEPSYEDLKSMKYMQHCLNEILRIYPIVPFNVRVALKDTTLPHGGGADGLQPIGILEGTPVGYSTYLMQHREDIYPSVESGFPPIEEFVPERWDNWTPKAWTYVPFNGGPRICIGQQFALTEMGYTITRILQRYSSIQNRMSEPPMLKADIVLQPGSGVQLAFFEDEKSQ
ncbi:cytochrome P450 alkane hydroxylase-like protein [Microthyrium microscopicum]|uniref:Cytochrome P450 alkane hydroxylase-like protein n=1 Tax=Microthyrium microscopicum TaxID=703497 RepID=A0A6A6UJD4_9PEZI|nr:cytochrome P450 alkane hydroxylase-like protein [Microthyrium microscopicum]